MKRMKLRIDRVVTVPASKAVAVVMARGFNSLILSRCVGRSSMVERRVVDPVTAVRFRSVKMEGVRQDEGPVLKTGSGVGAMSVLGSSPRPSSDVPVAERQGIRLQPGMDVGSTPTRDSRKAGRVVRHRTANARSSERARGFKSSAFRQWVSSVTVARLAPDQVIRVRILARLQCAGKATGRPLGFKIPDEWGFDSLPAHRATVGQRQSRPPQKGVDGGSNPPGRTMRGYPNWQRGWPEEPEVEGSTPSPRKTWNLSTTVVRSVEAREIPVRFWGVPPCQGRPTAESPGSEPGC